MIDGPYKLPKGWRWVRLGDVCLPTERRDPTKDPLAPFIYVDISSIDNVNGEIQSFKKLLGQDAPGRARKVIKTNDIIFATTRPYLKNIAVVSPDLDSQMCSTGFCVLRPNSEFVEPKYIFYLCRSNYVISQLSALSMRGASYPAVTDKDVFGVLIPLPCLEEQQGIVAKVEMLMEQVREARRLRQKAVEDADRLWQAVLADTFPRPGADLPPNWRWARLEEVCEVNMGQSPPSKTYNQNEVGLPFFQGKSDFGELYPSPRVWCSAPKKIAIEGDILISVRAPVGPTNLTNIKCCIGRGLAALRVRSELDRYWLLFYLRSIENLLASAGTGSTFNAITKKELVTIPVLLPPLEEQRRIITCLEETQEKIKLIKDSQAQFETELQRLEQSILDSAFKGEL